MNRKTLIKWYLQEILKDNDLELAVTPLSSPKKESEAGIPVSKIVVGLMAGEEGAIKQYEEALALPELKKFKSKIEEILAEEKEHFAELKEIKSKLT